MISRAQVSSGAIFIGPGQRPYLPPVGNLTEDFTLVAHQPDKVVVDPQIDKAVAVELP